MSADYRRSVPKTRLMLVFSTKWIRLWRWRVPIWAHVSVLVLDYARRQAAVYDLVTCKQRRVQS